MKSGSGPSKPLSLKSIPILFEFIVDTFGKRPCIRFLERSKNFNVGGRSANHSIGMVSEISAYLGRKHSFEFESNLEI